MTIHDAHDHGGEWDLLDDFRKTAADDGTNMLSYRMTDDDDGATKLSLWSNAGDEDDPKDLPYEIRIADDDDGRKPTLSYGILMATHDAHDAYDATRDMTYEFRTSGDEDGTNEMS